MIHLLFIITCLVWGSSFICMKKASLAFGPLSIGALRLLMGSGALLLLWFAQRRAWKLDRGHLPGLLLVAVVSYGWPFALQPYLIHKNSNSALIGMFVTLVPLLTVVASIPMLGLYPTKRQVTGIVLGLACFSLLMRDAWGAGGVPLVDLLLALTIPINYAVANTYVKRRFHDAPAISMTIAALGLAGLILLPLGVVFEPVRTEPHLGLAVGALVLLGLLATGLGYYCFYVMVQRRGPLYAGMVAYPLPIVAIACGWADGERVAARQLLAIAGVLAAVLIVQIKSGTPAVETVE